MDWVCGFGGGGHYQVTMRTDAELLREYAERRSEAAFAELVDRYLGLVYHAALRQLGGDAHRAEDVAQVVFMRLAAKAAALRRHAAVAGWLHTTTRFAASEARRAEQRRLARELEAHTMDEISRDPGAALDWERLRPVIDEALGELSERDREAVLLRYFTGGSHADVGARLHVSDQAARMRVDRALEKLQAAFARRGITSTGAALSAAFAEHAIGAVPAGLAAAVTAAAIAPIAGVGTGSALGIFMTTTKVASLAAVIALIGLGVATREYQATRDAEAAITSERQVNASLETSVATAQQRAIGMEQEVAALQKEFEAARATRIAAERRARSQPAGAGGPDPAAVATGEAFMARHPEVERAVMDAYHARMRAQFGAFYRARGFTPLQIEAFENAMRHGAGVQRMVTAPDGSTFILSVPGWLDPEKRQHEEQQLLTLLGEDGARQLRQTVSELPARTMATQFAGFLGGSPCPLTATQADALARAFAETSRGGDSRQTDWATLLSQMQPVLSQPQLAMLAGLQAQGEFASAMTAAARRTSAGRQSSDPGSTPGR